MYQNKLVGDIEESKKINLNIESPFPHKNEDAVQTPSITYEDISINEEYMEHNSEQDKIEGIHDKIIVGSIHILNTKDKKFMNKKIPAFSERVPTGDPFTVGNYILSDLDKISTQIMKIWGKVIKLIQLEPRFLIENLKIDSEVKQMEKIGQSIFMSTIETNDFVSPVEENFVEIHKELLKTREERGYHWDTEDVIVQDEEIWKKPALHPIIFEECIKKKDFVPPEPIKKLLEDNDFQDFEYEEYYRGCHLFVLIHGFQGSSIDMKLLKNSISMAHPEAIFLLAKSNENKTEGDIEEMGKRLAEEVDEFIDQYSPGSSLSRLSFISHSMGGLILRAALPSLSKYKHLMYTYISLSSPHLGYMYNSSKIINAGMWVLKKWKGSQSLTQIGMSDNSDPKQTFLYKLSEKPGLEWFKNILLASSFQDGYAPFDSARIQICSKVKKDTEKGNIYITMATNLLKKLDIECLYRIDVNFMINTKNIDTFIGRAAHIQFLENKVFMNMIIFRFKEFFD